MFVPSSSHRELHLAMVARGSDTAGGERSSRPGVEVPSWCGISRSRLQGALVGEGGRRESSGGESAAAGGNQFAPSAQSVASGGACMSSIPGHTPTQGQEGSQEGSRESGGSKKTALPIGRQLLGVRSQEGQVPIGGRGGGRGDFGGGLESPESNEVDSLGTIILRAE